MSLNDILLTPRLVAGLYPDTLVEPQCVAAPLPATAARQAPAADHVSFLGMNERKILVITDAPDAVYLPESALQFLTTILGACSLGIGDVAIVNWHPSARPYEEVLAYLSSRIVLLFDVDPLRFGLPLNFPPFQAQVFAGRTYLHAPSLDAIEGDKELKKSLWTALKKIFSLP
ncbi:MAG: hypothetical protein JWP27_1486 [Flaviaesturariibacter sp.]|nr:hypothetical protein [Flaviaesturariibacter sp.]